MKFQYLAKLNSDNEAQFSDEQSMKADESVTDRTGSMKYSLPGMKTDYLTEKTYTRGCSRLNVKYSGCF
jgi:hypothetical protein